MASAQTNIRSFMLKGPGRAAPTLVEDLTLYDPYFTPPKGLHLLEDPLTNFTSVHFISSTLYDESCRHVFCTQPRQTKVPALDERPDQATIYQVTAVCRKCRLHIRLEVDYTKGRSESPCPNGERPLHHLVHSSWRQNLAREEAKRQALWPPEGVFVFECSSPTCSAVVSIALCPAVISEEEVNILTDPKLLQDRTREAFESRRGDTEGMKQPSPTDVLIDLRAYFRNSWKKDPRSEISLDNKRFAVRFGPNGTACKEVLESLRFILKPEECWLVPRPDPNDNMSLLTNETNIFLDNVEHELNALILSRPAEERQLSSDNTATDDACRDMSRTLSCQSYDRWPGSRTASIDPANRPQPFILLGVPEDAGDDIILWAYETQCLSAPDFVPHLLTALRKIAAHRGSESLETKVAIEVSSGRFDYEQLQQAYRELGLSMEGRLEEEHIIGCFEARLQDSKVHEQAMREHLRVVGLGLNSQKIISYATNEIATYDQALAFLGADADTNDEFIQTLFGLKVSDSGGSQELAQKAVKMIAAQRKSEGLQAWITSGYANDLEADMDIGEAFQALEIPDRTVDDQMILSVYQMRQQEDTGNSTRFTRALKTIARSRGSSLLLGYLQVGGGEGLAKQSLEEPVGLDNIGNTCYLNSLLQFLFTIKEVRNIVLNFDQYKMDLGQENMVVKRVGQRRISPREVETAQKFALSLASLFRLMITSSQSAIKPDQELARLTLETDQVKEKIRRRSTIGGARPSLGTIDNRAVQGPMPPPVQTTSILEESPVISPREMEMTDAFTIPPHANSIESESYIDVARTQDSENSSEATLVSDTNGDDDEVIVTREQQQNIFDNKENLSPVKMYDARDTPDGETRPLRPASPSKINVQAGALANRAETETNHIEDIPMIYQPPPGPPPIPPRKPVQSATYTLEEYARQQDVTEVVGHCLFQLSCAMRPTGFDKSGEQQDEIHDLFFGENSIHTVPEKSTQAPPVPFLNIQAAVINQPKDVYAAMDNYFDLSDVGNGQQGYVSITRLPSILTVALGRVVWDAATSSQKKLDYHVAMPETIFMDRYLDAENDSDLMQKRKLAWSMKKELAELEAQTKELEEPHAQATNVPGLLDDARLCLKFLQNDVSRDPRFGPPIEIDPDLPDTLGAMADTSRKTLEIKKDKVERLNQQLTTMFSEMKQNPYRLHAAFFHRGSHGSGHYWVYIRDHKAKVWRKYNDDHVTIVNDLREIFDKPDSTGGWSGPANAYFLVYVKDGEQDGGVDALIETVRRDPVVAHEEMRDANERPQSMARPTNTASNDEGMLIWPIGTEPSWEQDAVHFGGPSQMTELPPSAFRSSNDDRKSDTASIEAEWGDYATADMSPRQDSQNAWGDNSASSHNPALWNR